MTTIEVISVTVVQGHGTDKVFMQTTLPNGIYPYTKTTTLKCEIAADAGPEWCRKNLGTYPEVIVEPKSK